LKKVPSVTSIGSLVTKVAGLKGGYDCVSVLIRVEEKEIFELRLEKLDLNPNKLSKAVHM
jgi:hypothetical protein